MIPPCPDIKAFRYAKITACVAALIFLIINFGLSSILLDRQDHSLLIMGGLSFLFLLISLFFLYSTWWETRRYQKICQGDNLVVCWQYDPSEIPRGIIGKLFPNLPKYQNPFALISRVGTYVSYKETNQ